MAVCTVILDAFWDITSELKGDRLPEIDEKVSAFIQSFRSEGLTSFVIPITRLGGKWGYLIMVPAAVIVLQLTGRGWKKVLPATFVIISTLLLNQVMKWVFNRPRPADDNHLTSIADWSLSYPSGHSMLSIAFYGFLIYITFKYIKRAWVKWTLTTLFLFLIISIGTSRVYLGVHYPSDVVAGYLAGLLWLAICIAGMRSINFYKLRRERNELRLAKENELSHSR